MKNLKNEISAILLATTMTATPAMAKENTNNYVMEQNSYYGIKLGNQTLEESFNKKAKFLLGEEAYNQYLTGDNIVLLQKQFDEMYGENAFVTLKEYEYRTKGLTKQDIDKEYVSTLLSLDYENRQLGIFKDSSTKATRENTISNLKIKESALNKIRETGLDDSYTTLYNLNEFTTACLGNASLNENIESFDTVWNNYKTNVLDPVVALVKIGDETKEYNAIELGKYTIYNKIEHNPITYNIDTTTKQIKLK